MPRSRSRSRGRDEDLYSVRIGNELPDDIKEDELRDKFDKYGDIGEIYIPKDRESGRSKGFAFVRFYNKDDREYCLEDVSKEAIYIDDKKCKVDFARSRPKGGGRLPPPETYRRRSRSRSRSRGRRYRSRSRSRDRSRRSRRSRSRSRSRSRDRHSRRRQRSYTRSYSRSYSRSRSRSRSRGRR